MSPLKRKVLALIEREVMSAPEIHDELKVHDAASIRRAVRQLNEERYITVDSQTGKDTYWKINDGIKAYIKGPDLRGTTKNAAKNGFKRLSGHCTWDKIPKTDTSRGYGYVQSQVL